VVGGKRDFRVTGPQPVLQNEKKKNHTCKWPAHRQENCPRKPIPLADLEEGKNGPDNNTKSQRKLHKKKKKEEMSRGGGNLKPKPEVSPQERELKKGAHGVLNGQA